MNTFARASSAGPTLAALLMLTTTGALAGGAPDPASDTSGIRLRYSDLDLSKPSDVARLYKRIGQAARMICESPSEWYGSTSRMNRCRERTIETTVARINHPQLNAYYRDHARQRVASR